MIPRVEFTWKLEFGSDIVDLQTAGRALLQQHRG